YTSGFADCGLFGVYAGCRPSQVHDVLKICRDELDRVATHGLDDDEVARAIGQLSGSTVLGLEDTGALMNR
ncbi:insulinase family protein, partial [Streptomyces sp. SID7499]|nr:insulinase family protein [Streptomyces sp. SID7499]